MRNGNVSKNTPSAVAIVGSHLSMYDKHHQSVVHSPQGLCNVAPTHAYWLPPCSLTVTSRSRLPRSTVSRTVSPTA